MPLSKVHVGFQERASQTTDQCNELAEAKKIIADLQRENTELRAHHHDQQLFCNLF